MALTLPWQLEGSTMLAGVGVVQPYRPVRAGSLPRDSFSLGGAARLSARAIELAEEPRCHTFGRTLRAAQRNIREAAAAWYEVEPSRVEVDDDVLLPPPASRALGRSRALRDRERKAHEQARAATAAAVAALRAVGLSERDTGTLLGLSHQRVHQLAPER
jgi:predicted RNase H-like HicB family nuclease